MFPIATLIVLAGLTASPLHAADFTVQEETRFTRHLSPMFQERLKAVFAELRSIRLEKSTPLHKEFFGPELTGQVYLNTFLMFDEFRMGHATDATVLGYSHPEFPTVMLTINYFNLDPSAFALRVSMPIHEALHFHDRQKVRAHRVCPAMGVEGEPIVSSIDGSSYKGLRSCDAGADGAYAIQAVMLNNIGRFCTTCSESQRADALRVADVMKNRVLDPEAFNKISSDNKEVVPE